jgi:dienelactone hydrolase
MHTTTPDIEQIATKISLGRINLAADIAIPERAASLVVFAHGSGSSRHSPRNRHVADVLNNGGVATILTDLLTEQEEAIDIQTAELRFDIGLLARRLVTITDWVGRYARLSQLSLGYFGASTGAAATLVAAADRSKRVRAIVSRGGRPDLAGDALVSVVAPVLFIVGSHDPVVRDLNYSAAAQLPTGTEHKVEIVRGASHLFEEPGTLDQVAILARDWFEQHLSANAE